MLRGWYFVYSPQCNDSLEPDWWLFTFEAQFCGRPRHLPWCKVEKTRLPNGIYVWGLSPSRYVNHTVKNCQTRLTQKLNNKYKILTRAENPLYCVDTDVSEPLDDECSSFFQHLIGIMRWMVELGRVDIAVEVSLLSSYLAYPWEGHLEAAIYIMGYPRLKHNTWLDKWGRLYPDRYA